VLSRLTIYREGSIHMLHIKGHPSNCSCNYCNPNKLAKILTDIAEDIQCSGFFACPGSDIKKIYTMRTCSNCAATIKLRRIAEKIKNN